MLDTVSIRWGANGECTINLRSAVFNMPLTNWKMLMRLMAENPDANKTAAAEMQAWFNREIFNSLSPFRETKKAHDKLYRMYRTLIFKGDM